VQVTETFSGVPGLPNGSYNCVRHRMVGVVTFPFDFDQVPPTVWARASGSIGWKDTTQFDYSYEVPWGRVVAGSLTRHGLRLETFVYDVLNGTQHVWEPAPPQSAQIAFTAVGRLPAGVLGVGGGLQGQLDVRTAPNPAKRRVIVTLTLPAASDIHAIVLDVAGSWRRNRRCGHILCGPRARRVLRAARSGPPFPSRRTGRSSCVLATHSRPFTVWQVARQN